MLFLISAFSLLLRSCFSQGKEIIEFYLKELENEGITHVPRWAPSSHSIAPPGTNGLATSPPVPTKHTIAAFASVPQTADAKDDASQDAKQDGGALPADALTEILAGTPEGSSLRTIELFLLRRSH